MNKVILMGRLTADPEIRYSQGQQPMCIARYTIAVDKRKQNQDGSRDANFIRCVAFVYAQGPPLHGRRALGNRKL